jgi:hypothetical protein
MGKKTLMQLKNQMQLKNRVAWLCPELSYILLSRLAVARGRHVWKNFTVIHENPRARATRARYDAFILPQSRTQISNVRQGQMVFYCKMRLELFGGLALKYFKTTILVLVLI